MRFPSEKTALKYLARKGQKEWHKEGIFESVFSNETNCSRYETLFRIVRGHEKYFHQAAEWKLGKDDSFAEIGENFEKIWYLE
jgi:hypothetical protein